MVNLAADDPLSAEFREAIGTELDRFLQDRTDHLDDLAADLAEPLRLATAFTAGGKRLRPAFCAWGYLAATGGTQVPPPVLRVAAALDLLHVGILIHDDVMDGSATRRGLAAAHLQFADGHRLAGLRGSSEAYGRAGAILLGDLLQLWSVEMVHTSGMPDAALARAAGLLAAVRTEVTAGQFLDIAAQSRRPTDARTDPDGVLAQVRRVVEYKTARYTVIRPLQIGAALGGGSPVLEATLEAYGSPLGRAFQYRDDILGVFGDESLTGKPAGDDLREGKLTALIAQAMRAGSAEQATQLDTLLGTPLSAQQVDQARQIILDSGALAATEADILADADRAVAALAALAPGVRAGLTRLATLAVERDV